PLIRRESRYDVVQYGLDRADAFAAPAKNGFPLSIVQNDALIGELLDHVGFGGQRLLRINGQMQSRHSVFEERPLLPGHFVISPIASPNGREVRASGPRPCAACACE